MRVDKFAINLSKNVGEGTHICSFAFVEQDAVIGKNCTIKNGACIWNGVTLGNNVFVGPGVMFTNDRYPSSPPANPSRYDDESHWLEPTTVEDNVSIGAGAIILPGVTIGEGARIGAGALVLRDVPAGSLVLGRYRGTST